MEPRPGNRTRRFWSLLGAAGLIMASTACGSDSSGRGSLLLVGDSIFFQAANELKRELRDEGWDVTVVAHPGAGLAGGGYTEVDWPTELRDELASDPDVVVVELGTNACGDPCGSRRSAIEAFMGLLEDVSHVFWLTVRTDPPRPHDAQAINEALRNAAGDHDNLELLPYHDWLDDRPGQAPRNNVHLTASGQQALAERLGDALPDDAN